MSEPPAEVDDCQHRSMSVLQAAYRRVNVGGKQEDPAGIVMGKSAEQLMPVLARISAPIHQRPALQFTLRAIVKIVQGIPVSL